MARQHHPIFLKAFGRTKTGFGFFFGPSTAGSDIEHFHSATLADYSWREIERLMFWLDEMSVEQAIWILPMLLSYNLADPDNFIDFWLSAYACHLHDRDARWEAFKTMRKWNAFQRTSLSELLALSISRVMTSCDTTEESQPLQLLMLYANARPSSTPDQVEQLGLLL